MMERIDCVVHTCDSLKHRERNPAHGNPCRSMTGRTHTSCTGLFLSFVPTPPEYTHLTIRACPIRFDAIIPDVINIWTITRTLFHASNLMRSRLLAISSSAIVCLSSNNIRYVVSVSSMYFA